MARIKLGAAIADITGKVGGSVFQHGPSGNVLRNQSGIINRRTPNQFGPRAYTPILQRQWFLLEPTQRSTWDQYAIYLRRQQKNGTGKTMSGQALFTFQNFYRYAYAVANGLGVTPHQSVPTFGAGCAPCGMSSCSCFTDACNCVLTRAVNSALEFLIVKSTFSLRSSQKSVTNRLRLLIFTTVDGVTQDLGDGFTRSFGRWLYKDMEVLFHTAIARKDTGMISEWTPSRLTVIGTP